MVNYGTVAFTIMAWCLFVVDISNTMACCVHQLLGLEAPCYSDTTHCHNPDVYDLTFYPCENILCKGYCFIGCCIVQCCGSIRPLLLNSFQSVVHQRHIQWRVNNFDTDSVVKNPQKKGNVRSHRREVFKCHSDVAFGKIVSSDAGLVLHGELMWSLARFEVVLVDGR